MNSLLLLNNTYFLSQIEMNVIDAVTDKCYRARLAQYFIAHCMFSQKVNPFLFSITIVTLSLVFQLNNVWSFGAGGERRVRASRSPRREVRVILRAH